MTQEEKQLLFKDLCTRLPYGVICQLSNKDADVSIIEKLELGGLEHFIAGSMCVKPYLRPMSSMTEEEKEEYESLLDRYYNEWEGEYYHTLTVDGIDWLNKHHFDYRIVPSTGKNMIESGLAIEAKEGMYKTNFNQE